MLYEDHDVLIPGHLAAERVGVSRQLINYWRISGQLPVATWRDGRPLYRLGDVLAAERATRRSRFSSRNPARAAA